MSPRKLFGRDMKREESTASNSMHPLRRKFHQIMQKRKRERARGCVRERERGRVSV